MKVIDPGKFECVTKEGYKMVASFSMFLIRKAWHRGMNVEDLADGFGPGVGTHGDWSAVRDSSEEARDLMLDRALKFLDLEPSM